MFDPTGWPARSYTPAALRADRGGGPDTQELLANAFRSFLSKVLSTCASSWLRLRITPARRHHTVLPLAGAQLGALFDFGTAASPTSGGKSRTPPYRQEIQGVIAPFATRHHAAIDGQNADELRPVEVDRRHQGPVTCLAPFQPSRRDAMLWVLPPCIPIMGREPWMHASREPGASTGTLVISFRKCHP